MEIDEKIEELKDKNLHKNTVHKVLAHSYLFSFVLFLVSLFLDFLFPLKIFKFSVYHFLGAIFLIFGTFLILWAQNVSLKLQKKEEIKKEIFFQGPYRYTRSPTHLGLFFLIFGFGVIANALFIVIFSAISFIVSKFTFLKKEEEILSLKYGAPYLEYKRSMKF